MLSGEAGLGLALGIWDRQMAHWNPTRHDLGSEHGQMAHGTTRATILVLTRVVYNFLRKLSLRTDLFRAHNATKAGEVRAVHFKKQTSVVSLAFLKKDPEPRGAAGCSTGHRPLV